MLRRRQINSDPRGRGARLLSGLAEIVRWPFERAAWALERGLLWPLRERFAGRAPAGQGAGAAALAATGAAAILVVVLLVPGADSGGGESTATQTRVALASPPPADGGEQPEGRVLQGSPPNFGVGDGTGVPADGGDGSGEAGTSSASPPATDAGDEAADAEGETAATASSRKPVPAGPAAMKVARRFSEAFVFYEIGERRARARTVFGETAAPELATALGERPPRLPAEAKVPKAKVLNLVPGPRAGRAYTVSVSLLRVGVTSELRLELSKQDGRWLVTDVRG